MDTSRTLVRSHLSLPDAVTIFEDHLSLDEARVVVGKILALIPQSISGNAELYIDGLAKVLMHYPRLGVRNAADPYCGVARELKYLPTPADVRIWCEREVAWLRRIADTEALTRRRIARQEPQPPTEEERQRVKIGFKRLVDHLGACEKVIRELDRTKQLAHITKTDSRLFDQECREAGIDPATATASPYLQELMRARLAAEAAEQTDAAE
jgi:hypothetical protein